MIDVITISSKGQIVIPKKLREDAGLDKQDKLLAISDGNKIILEKISKKEAKEKMIGLMDYFSKEFKKNGITRDDVLKEIKDYRNEKKKR